MQRSENSTLPPDVDIEFPDEDCTDIQSISMHSNMIVVYVFGNNISIMIINSERDKLWYNKDKRIIIVKPLLLNDLDVLNPLVTALREIIGIDNAVRIESENIILEDYTQYGEDKLSLDIVISLINIITKGIVLDANLVISRYTWNSKYYVPYVAKTCVGLKYERMAFLQINYEPSTMAITIYFNPHNYPNNIVRDGKNTILAYLQPLNLREHVNFSDNLHPTTLYKFLSLQYKAALNENSTQVQNFEIKDETNVINCIKILNLDFNEYADCPDINKVIYLTEFYLRQNNWIKYFQT
jgi:hypothetical protein